MEDRRTSDTGSEFNMSDEQRSLAIALGSGWEEKHLLGKAAAVPMFSSFRAAGREKLLRQDTSHLGESLAHINFCRSSDRNAKATSLIFGQDKVTRYTISRPNLSF
ncbi:hypothetical protein CHARACLAT_021781 [Characodon lateralis]|uniref:Uncharacterized protein n=1 Tax=Characodon lateralis TaxID=208331 RepID=A0ABU7D0A8_9TELE|nr:hypothetical protein [Characodon lateralis]